MNKKNRQIFIAIVFAILGVVLISLYIKEVERKYVIEEKTVEVLVAKKDIGTREVLTPEFLAIAKIPKSFVQPGALKANTQLLDEKGQPMYATIVPIKKGEQILFTKIASFGKETGLSLTIPEKHYAISMDFDKESGVGEFIKPGDYVDMFLYINYAVSDKKKSKMDMKSETKYKVVLLFPKVYVLGVKDQLTVSNVEVKDEKRPTSYMRGYTITFAMKPEDIPKFIYARKKGEIILALRPMGDKEVREIPEAELQDIVKESEGKEVKPPEESGEIPGISIIKGLQKQMQSLGGVYQQR